MTSRPLATLELGAADEQALRTLAKRRTTAQALALRARIVLACAAGEANCASTRRARSRRSTVPSRSCRCRSGRPSGAATITSGMARWRPRYRHRSHPRPLLQTPSCRRVSALPRCCRCGRAARPRHPPRYGQLRHPQGTGNQGMVRQAASLSHPLHAHLRLLAQPGRTLVRPLNRAPDPTRRPPQRQGTRGCGRRPLSPTATLPQNRSAGPNPLTTSSDRSTAIAKRRSQPMLLLKRTFGSRY
jgi:hypothetical protein